MSFQNESDSVRRAAGSMPGGIKPGTYPTSSKSAPNLPRRAGAAPAPPGSGAVGFDPNENHITVSENDQIMLGVLPHATKKVPNRSNSSG